MGSFRRIDGVDVRFCRRDINQCTDKELRLVRKLIEAEKNSQYAGTEIVSIEIESDFIDRWACKYLVTTRETIDLSDLPDED